MQELILLKRQNHIREEEKRVAIHGLKGKEVWLEFLLRILKSYIQGRWPIFRLNSGRTANLLDPNGFNWPRAAFSSCLSWRVNFFILIFFQFTHKDLSSHPLFVGLGEASLIMSTVFPPLCVGS